jgi:sulfane dehydrogenase subunit SoxC
MIGDSAARSSVLMDPATSFRHLVPLSRLQDFITPTQDVYVIAHMGVARVEPSEWRLRIDGMVERPSVLDYQGLLRLPAHEITAVLECFGNPLEPEAPTRRVGNVTWRGALLADVLAGAGVKPGATAVWLEGLDSGMFSGSYIERYIKDVPLARAIQQDVLVAYAMNGEPLTHEHGFPARVFVPGYFGTNSVKWLSRITLSSTRPEGLFTTQLYNRSIEVDGRDTRQPARELDVQAVIVHPADGDTVAQGRRLITGWAWSASPITRVEVSTDSGASWCETGLVERGDAPTWQRFAMNWIVTATGAHEIRCRATDAQGRIQPVEGRNRIHAIAVTVV